MTPDELREMMEEGAKVTDHSYLIRKAKMKDDDEDKIKLSRMERARLCAQYKLGFWAVSEEGVIQWQSISCGEWDLCPGCRRYEAGRRRKTIEDNIAKIKEQTPNSKTRIKRGMNAEDVSSFEKKIKRHGGKFVSVEGEQPGTKDVIVVMEDDTKRSPEQMDDIYGAEESIADYELEDRLSKQKQRGGKRMAGKLGQGSSAGIAKEGTERLRLPKFRVPAETNDQVEEISKEILPTYKVETLEQYQDAIYDMAERFAARLDEENIIYDVKMDFKNVELDKAMASWNSLCPINVTIETSNSVNQTLDADQLAFLAAQDAHYDEQLAIMNG